MTAVSPPLSTSSLPLTHSMTCFRVMMTMMSFLLPQPLSQSCTTPFPPMLCALVALFPRLWGKTVIQTCSEINFYASISQLHFTYSRLKTCLPSTGKSDFVIQPQCPSLTYFPCSLYLLRRSGRCLCKMEVLTLYHLFLLPVY